MPRNPLISYGKETFSSFLPYSKLLLSNAPFKRLLQNVLSLSILGIHVAQFPRSIF